MNTYLRTNSDPEHLEADLNIASFLLVKSFRLLGLVSGNGNRLQFRFADPDQKAAEAAMAYLQGESVSAKALTDAQRALKTLLYSRKGNGNEKRERRY